MRKLVQQLLLTFLIVFPASVLAAENTQKPFVIASFSIIADMAKQVAGGAIEIHTLVPASADVHTYEPTPADAKKIANARLILTNGLGFEQWLPKLVKSSGGMAWVVPVTKGVKPVISNGKSIDPHAWQDVSNAIIYATNIRDALLIADPLNEATYRKNAQHYIEQLTELNDWVKNTIAQVPEAKRRAITSHDALGYFARAYGITLIPAQLSTEGEVSAKTMASLIDQLRNQSVRAVFLENLTNPRLMEQLARDGNATIGGTLYSDSLSETSGKAPTYISMIKHNVNTIIAALAK